MSSPFGRSSDPNTTSPYAPRWARDPDAAPDQPPRVRMAGNKYFPDSPADDSDYVAERGLHFRSLEPTLVPEPPMPESWQRDGARPLARGNSVTRMLLRFLVVVLLAAGISFVIAVLLPGDQRFALLQKTIKESIGTPDDKAPMSAVQSAATMNAQQPAPSADRSQLPPAHAERAVASPERLAAAQPGVTQPAATTPPVSESSPSAAPKPPSSTPGSAAHAATTPTQLAAIDSAVKTSAVPVTSVKTVLIHPKAPQARPLNPDEIDTLLKQGANFVSVGDFASARLVFGRVAEAHDARGAFALAATYDPIALGKINARGATPDIAKARQWYSKASELGSQDAASRLATLEKGTGASVAGGYTVISAHENAIGTTGKQPGNAATSETSQASDASGATASYWKNDASIMRLDATGISRKFIFSKPSEEQMKAGAKVGSLRFDGQISGDGYSGTAFSYTEKCGRERFPVSGQIENNGARVILSGKSPQMDGNCQEIGKTDQTLVFDFVEPSGK